MSTIHCPKCNQEYELDDSIVGCSVQCAVCDTTFVAQLPDNLKEKQTTKEDLECSIAPPKNTYAEVDDKRKRKGGRRAFLIVLSMFAIVGIVLAGIVIASLNANSKAEKNLALVTTHIKLLDDAIQQYMLDVGHYPSDLQCLVENIDQTERWNGPYIMPAVPRDPWGNEYQYLVPGDYGDFDLYPLGMDNRAESMRTDTDLKEQWKKRMLAESKGELDMSKGRDFYDSHIVLPDHFVFSKMAISEANGQQYDKLRHAGYSPQEIINYVMREKYLPLVRYASGEKNIVDNTKLSKENWAIIKKEMLKRQCRGLEKNFSRIKNVYAGYPYRDYDDILSQAWDARINAMQNNEDPDKVRIIYPDFLLEKPEIANAVTKTIQNSW